MIENAIAYFIVNTPSPILFVTDTATKAMEFSETRIAPMIESSEELTRLINPPLPGHDTGNRKLFKKFPGGFIVFGGAQSPTSFRALSIRLLLMDEVDRYPANVGEEGDPIELAIARTTTYWNHKIVMASTPTAKETSIIWREFQESDQRYYYIPCPHCGQYQIMRFGASGEKEGWTSIVWDTDDDGKHYPETAQFQCMFTEDIVGDEEYQKQQAYYNPSQWKKLKICGKLSHESKKRKMIEAGIWIPHHPENEVPGFTINSLYSSTYEWKRLIEQWLAAKTLDKKQAFINTRLAEPWEERNSSTIEAHDLFYRLEDFDADNIQVTNLGETVLVRPGCPTGVGVLVGGADVQENRIEVFVWGIGKDEHMWLVDHQIFYGNPAQKKVWITLADFLRTASYPNLNGAEVQVKAWAIDAGAGKWIPAVYPFVNAMNKEGISLYAVKGHNKPDASPVPARPTRNKQYGVDLFMVGVSAIKDILVPRLRLDKNEPGAVHLRITTEQEILKQLTAERKFRKKNTKSTRPEMYWKQIYSNNEALDCWVYAYFTYLLHIRNKKHDMDEMVEKISSTKPSEPDEEKKPEEKNKIRVPGYRPPRKIAAGGSVFGGKPWHSGWHS